MQILTLGNLESGMPAISPPCHAPAPQDEEPYWDKGQRKALHPLVVQSLMHEYSVAAAYAQSKSPIRRLITENSAHASNARRQRQICILRFPQPAGMQQITQRPPQ